MRINRVFLAAVTANVLLLCAYYCSSVYAGFCVRTVQKSCAACIQLPAGNPGYCIQPGLASSCGLLPCQNYCECDAAIHATDETFIDVVTGSPGKVNFEVDLNMPVHCATLEACERECGLVSCRAVEPTIHVAWYCTNKFLVGAVCQ